MKLSKIDKIKEILDSSCDSYNLSIGVSDSETITISKTKQNDNKSIQIGFQK